MPSAELVALDEDGGQAIARVSDDWYLLSIDTGWKLEPTTKYALWRCVANGLCHTTSETFVSAEALRQSVSERCVARMPPSLTSYAEVRHLDPYPERTEPFFAIERERPFAAFATERRMPGQEQIVETYLLFRRLARAEARSFPSVEADDLASEAIRTLLLQPQPGWPWWYWDVWSHWIELHRPPPPWLRPPIEENAARLFIRHIASRLSRSEDRRRKVSDDELEGARDPGPTPEERVSVVELVASAFEGLTPPQEELLQLLSKGMSPAEAAASLRLNVGTVKKRMRDIRVHFAKALGRKPYR